MTQPKTIRNGSYPKFLPACFTLQSLRTFLYTAPIIRQFILTFAVGMPETPHMFRRPQTRPRSHLSLQDLLFGHTRRFFITTPLALRRLVFACGSALAFFCSVLLVTALLFLCLGLGSFASSGTNSCQASSILPHCHINFAIRCIPARTVHIQRFFSLHTGLRFCSIFSSASLLFCTCVRALCRAASSSAACFFSHALQRTP